MPHALLCLILAFAGAAPATSPDPPVAVFAELDGTWTGAFVGYDVEGRELYRIRVTQTYETIDEHTQRVTIEDAFPDGRVVTGRGRNVARRAADGTLTLRCVVEKSDGDRVEHDGRLGRDPDGRPQLLWRTSRPGRVELFRETVRREAGRTVYEINGLGRYGDTLVLMHGRYLKRERPADDDEERRREGE